MKWGLPYGPTIKESLKMRHNNIIRGGPQHVQNLAPNNTTCFIFQTTHFFYAFYFSDYNLVGASFMHQTILYIWNQTLPFLRKALSSTFVPCFMFSYSSYLFFNFKNHNSKTISTGARPNTDTSKEEHFHTRVYIHHVLLQFILYDPTISISTQFYKFLQIAICFHETFL